MVVVLAQQAVGREPQIVERGADARQVISGLGRQRQRAVLPDEQADSQLLFEPPDLMADCGLGDVQFARRVGEAQMPRSRFERPQSVQRRQSGGHLSDTRYMNLSHPKRDEVSFVDSPNRADIMHGSLALGAEDVQLFTPIDDKSS